MFECEILYDAGTCEDAASVAIDVELATFAYRISGVLILVALMKISILSSSPIATQGCMTLVRAHFRQSERSAT